MEPLTLAEIAERTGADIVHRGPGFEDRAVRGVVATDLMSDALTCETDGVLMVTALASPQALRTADMIGAVGVLFTLGKALPRDIPAMAGQLGLTVLRTRLPKFETCAALLDRPGGAVNPRLPITEERAPLLVQDLIFTLHVRDVMSAPVIVAARSDSLRHIQELMREYGISGVPIAEDGRLYGIVSLDDIIRALDGGYIGDSAALRMTEQVVVLDEDMPLSFAIRFFEKYRYGRFPVLDHSRRLSGIVTTRNINQSLVVELSRELGRMEARDLGDRSAEDKAYLLREYAVKKFDFENAGQASHGLKSFLKQHGSDAGFVRRAAVASYELEMNLVVHSDGGTLTLFAKPGLAEIVARDNGPGIADVEQALVEGFSTAGDWVRSLGFGAGMGLPNARRVADQFDIQSEPGRGTTVRAVIQQNHATETGDDS